MPRILFPSPSARSARVETRNTRDFIWRVFVDGTTGTTLANGAEFSIQRVYCEPPVEYVATIIDKTLLSLGVLAIHVGNVRAGAFDIVDRIVNRAYFTDPQLSNIHGAVNDAALALRESMDPTTAKTFTDACLAGDAVLREMAVTKTVDGAKPLAVPILVGNTEQITLRLEPPTHPDGFVYVRPARLVVVLSGLRNEYVR